MSFGSFTGSDLSSNSESVDNFDFIDICTSIRDVFADRYDGVTDPENDENTTAIYHQVYAIGESSRQEDEAAEDFDDLGNPYIDLADLTRGTGPKYVGPTPREKQAGEIDNLTVSLGQSTLVVLCGFTLARNPRCCAALHSVTNNLQRASWLPRYQEETSIARGGEEQLDMKTDVKMDVKLDMELDMKISHERGRRREACAREEKKKSAVRHQSDRRQTGDRDEKIVNQENKNSADLMTWREYEALRNEMRREFHAQDDELKGTVQEIFQQLNATNVTVTRMQDQTTDIQRSLNDLHLLVQNLAARQQQDDDEDPELQDDAHNARGAPRGDRARNWAPLGRNGRGQDEEDGLGKPKFSIPKFEGGADVEEYLTWELKIEKLWNLHPHYTEDRKIKLASSEFDGYALRWWDAFVRNRDEDGEQPIQTWRAMKEAMTSRFVPTNYLRNIYDKLTLLRQGVKTVDEYYMEMEMLIQRGRVRESLEITMQRFLHGLKYDIKVGVKQRSKDELQELGVTHWPHLAGAFDALRPLLYSV
ncbi:hypothetical protein QYE76_026484 [Lolium multiflorum]|uniref:Retrotransposon gag domain-containing protein n=1 Tax=Lolium multiflorum TaxID=4521 RepID=A0AAD8RIP1_LOLMU|nr:hypothetical protein QYE76_026484 [Lolium multiflorum]